MFEQMMIGWQYWRLKYGLRFHDREHLLRWQDQQVRRFLKQVRPKSPFYQSHHAGLALAEWQQAPTIDKQIMMDHFDTLNTAGVSKAEALGVALQAEEDRNFAPTLNGLTVGLSSGTSGNRGLFLISRAERYRWVGAVAAKLLPEGQSLFSSQRIAFFLRANSNLYETVGSRRIDFQFFDLIQPPPSHLERLNKLQPTILVAPPSMLRYLAEQNLTELLHIQPQRVISGAEVLDPLDEQVIERGFDQIVHQVYQATEGFLASTCRCGTLHLHEDIVAVQPEYLDEQKRKFIPIITDFNRSSQPIIRYRLNDILTLREQPCPCGSPMLALEQIEGRCDDQFIFADGIVLFPDFVRRAVITASEAITAYSVRQQTPDQICVALHIHDAAPEAIQAAVERNLKRAVQQAGAPADNITIRFDNLPALVPSSTKLRRVIREFVH